jgi:hypothetical protein
MAAKPTPKESGAERAARLREQIEKLTHGTPDADETQSEEKELSPREFIHKRMRELDKKK